MPLQFRRHQRQITASATSSGLPYSSRRIPRKARHHVDISFCQNAHRLLTTVNTIAADSRWLSYFRFHFTRFPPAWAAGL